MNNEKLSTLEPISHSDNVDVDEGSVENVSLSTMLDNAEYIGSSDITEADERYYSQAVQDLIEVHNRYLELSDKEKLLVLKNNPHMLFLEGTSLCHIHKCVIKAITEIESYLAMGFFARNIYMQQKSRSNSMNILDIFKYFSRAERQQRNEAKKYYEVQAAMRKEVYIAPVQAPDLEEEEGFITPGTEYVKCTKGRAFDVKIIALDAHYAYLYALNYLKEPFPLGEASIATDVQYSYLYALNILKGPFPLGEPTLKCSDVWYEDYEENVLIGVK